MSKPAEKPRLFAHYSKIPAKLWRWKNFRPAEIACRGTGEILIDFDAMDRLQALRASFGKPIMVTSGYRSPKHNRKVKGAKNSQHLYGKAFDISMANHDPHAFEAAARAAGFVGFGFYPRDNFMHIDTGEPRTWGEPWPTTAAPFPEERPASREKVSDSRTIKAAKVATAALGADVALDVPDVQGTIDKLSWLPDGSTIKAVLIAVVVIALAVVAYARWDDWRKGKR